MALSHHQRERELGVVGNQRTGGGAPVLPTDPQPVDRGEDVLSVETDQLAEVRVNGDQQNFLRLVLRDQVEVCSGTASWPVIGVGDCAGTTVRAGPWAGPSCQCLAGECCAMRVRRSIRFRTRNCRR